MARVGYRFANGWRIQLDALNMLNSATDQATYAYGSLLTTDALFALCNPAHGSSTVPAAVCANGVMDYVLPSDRAAGVSADARWADGNARPLNIGRWPRDASGAFPAYQAPAPNYDWTGFLCRRSSCGNVWSKTSSSTINTVTGAPRRCHLRQHARRLARRHSARLRLHDAVPCGVWR